MAVARRVVDLPIGVVGGGIVGLAVARELTRRLPGVEVVVFEKQHDLAAHQTGHNSGVVHAGVYDPPDSLKARLCTAGRAMLAEYCADRGLAYEVCGKLVVAVDRDELGRLDDLEARALENGVPGLRRLPGAAIPEVEPHATGIAALHSPETAITDFAAVARALAADVEAAGGSVLRSVRVEAVARRGGTVEVRTSDGPHRVRHLVVCAGLQSDRVGIDAAGSAELRIVPFRGEYMAVAAAKQDLVRGMVYPVPDPRYPVLGVHFTRLVGGGLEVGPNAVLALSREGYRRRDVDVRDVLRTLTWPGTWRLARAHWRTGVAELVGSLSRRAYMRRARRYVPAIGSRDVVRGRTGVRAQALARDGSLVDDFRIDHADGVTSVRNAPSPAATSSLAIAEHVIDRLPPLS